MGELLLGLIVLFFGLLFRLDHRLYRVVFRLLSLIVGVVDQLHTGRRRGCLVRQPHRAHWQPLEYNALHGGMNRLFEAIEPATLAAPAWNALVRAIGGLCTAARAGRAAPQPWFVEAHQFRIDTTDGIGRPTPEGAHRDGVDFVAVILIGRHQVKGGETRIFEADGPNGKRFTMTAPWTMLLLDDATVIHESTPIQPLGPHGHRDTLVLTYRAGSFQGADA